MTGLVTLGGHPVAGSQLPVSIDYPAALALRQMALVQDELTRYLLAPEVSALLHYVHDLHRKMQLATLWNTGAHINEAAERRRRASGKLLTGRSAPGSAKRLKPLRPMG